eukprot:CFRG4321T1
MDVSRSSSTMASAKQHAPLVNDKPPRQKKHGKGGKNKQTTTVIPSARIVDVNVNGTMDSPQPSGVASGVSEGQSSEHLERDYVSTPEIHAKAQDSSSSIPSEPQIVSTSGADIADNEVSDILAETLAAVSLTVPLTKSALKVEDGEEERIGSIDGSQEDNSTVPVTPTNQERRSHHHRRIRQKDVCRFFLQGKCKFFDSCRFSHDVVLTHNNKGQRLVNSVHNQAFSSVSYSNNGRQSVSHAGNFHQGHNTNRDHRGDEGLGGNSASGNLRRNHSYVNHNSNGVCTFWRQNKCRFGGACKFSHVGIPRVGNNGGYFNPQMRLHSGGMPTPLPGTIYGYYSMPPPQVYDPEMVLHGINPEMFAQAAAMYQLPPPGQFYAPPPLQLSHHLQHQLPLPPLPLPAEQQLPLPPPPVQQVTQQSSKLDSPSPHAKETM